MKKIYILGMFFIFLFNNAFLISMKLSREPDSHSLWPIIIARCDMPTKNALGQCSTALHSLHSKNNIDLYLQKSLVLTQTQSDYALSYSAYQNNIPAVENLLRQGFTSYYSYCGMATSPLAIAKYNKNKELIKLLKRYDETDDRSVGNKLLPHALAVFFGDIKRVRKYIETKKYNPVYESSQSAGATLLKLAIYKGHRNVVELLLTHPKTIECINSGKKGDRAIGMAFRTGNAHIVRMLLAIPSLELTVKDWYIFQCAKGGYTDCLQMLLQRGEMPINEGTTSQLWYPYGDDKGMFYGDIPPLTIAAYNGHIGIVMLLLAHKQINVNQPFYNRYKEKIFIDFTPLYAASLRGHTAIVKQLLAHPDIKPCLYMEQYTPMHIACKKGYVDIVRLLAKHSPKLLRMKTKETKKTPYKIAKDYNQQDVRSLLGAIHSVS